MKSLSHLTVLVMLVPVGALLAGAYWLVIRAAEYLNWAFTLPH